MKMKIYTNPTCHYCNKIKTELTKAGLEYEEIITSEHIGEWNEIIRVTGLGMTPTIVYQEETWMPNRDFRTAEELIARVKHFQEHPMKRLSTEERMDQINNAIKNITLLLNQTNQTLQSLQQQVNTTITPNVVPPPHPTAQHQVQ
tara:strand:+ start:16 stop:450 length:435 start_codon:yes stop_codon:yes gene_type:complete